MVSPIRDKRSPPSPSCPSPKRRGDVYTNSRLTDSLRWMRLIASPSSGAMPSTVSLGICFSGGTGIVSVSTRPSIGRLLQSLDRAADQQPVRGRQKDLPGAVLVHHFGGAADRAGREIMSSKIRATRPSTWPPITLACLVFSAVLRRLSMMARCPPSRAMWARARLMLPSSGLTTTKSSSAEVHRPEVLVDHRGRVEMIHGNVEEALDLGGVQVHGQHAVGAGAGDQVGHQLGRDRHAALVLAVLPGVAEVGHHGRDPIGAGPLEALDHDQQFHQVLVDRRAGGLDDEHVAAADVLVDLAGNLAVGEIAHHRAAQRQPQILADPFGQARGGRVR